MFRSFLVRVMPLALAACGPAFTSADPSAERPATDGGTGRVADRDTPDADPPTPDADAPDADPPTPDADAPDGASPDAAPPTSDAPPDAAPDAPSPPACPSPNAPACEGNAVRTCAAGVITLRGCPSGQTCTDGACACPAGLTDCGGGACVNLDTDGTNCGHCGGTCSRVAACVDGTCR